jgi:hypothetical protein
VDRQSERAGVEIGGDDVGGGASSRLQKERHPGPDTQGPGPVRAWGAWGAYSPHYTNMLRQYRLGGPREDRASDAPQFIQR